MSVETQPWVLELKQRLETPPPRGPESSNGDSVAGLMAVTVTLWVEASELWCGFEEQPGEELWAGSGLGFPCTPVAAASEVWGSVAETVRERFGVDSGHVLKIGQLDVVPLADERQLQPLVVAVPGPEVAGGVRTSAGIVAVPLSALANPSLAEERMVEQEDRTLRLRVLHVGRHRLWGAAEWIVENLLERVGLTPT